MVNLDEADPAFSHTASQQAIVGIGRLGITRFGTIKVEGSLCFLREIHQLGSSGLHAVRHFVGIDACVDLGIPYLVETFLIELANQIEGIPLGSLVDAGGIGNMQDGIPFASERHALVFGRKKA